MSIDRLRVPGGGALGLVPCPGRSHGDTAADLAAGRRHGATMLLSLVEDGEWARLGLEAGPRAVRASGLDWHRLPVPDMQPPGPSFTAGWPVVAAAIRRAWDADALVLVHCAAGLGRTGTVVAGMLVGAGMAPGVAIALVRQVRPGAIETAEQVEWVMTGPGLRIEGGAASLDYPPPRAARPFEPLG